MGKNIYFVLLVLVILVALGFFFMPKSSSDKNDKSVQNETQIIYFYSTQCLYCQKVKRFFANNDVHNKVVFEEKEVSQNRDNLIQLVKIRKRCGLPEKKSISVPLLWTGSECIVGGQNIIKFFKGKI